MWDLVGASPTGPTLNGQPDIEDFKAGFMGERLAHPQNRGALRPAHYYELVYLEPRKNPPLVTGSEIFPARLVIKKIMLYKIDKYSHWIPHLRFRSGF
jgi:hypothetical protein